MLGNKKSLSTVGIYLCPVLTIFNLAIERGIVRFEFYPFGKRKYIIPTGRNMKSALDIDQIKQIFHYKTEPGSSLEKAKDFWMFSYLCNGMNMADIARMRWSCLSTQYIAFEREKTKRDNPVKIVVLRNAPINSFIEKWAKSGLNKKRRFFEKKREGENYSISKVQLSAEIAKYCIENALTFDDLAPENSALANKIVRLYQTIRVWNSSTKN